MINEDCEQGSQQSRKPKCEGYISVDIGSTYTKGALFTLDQDNFILQKQVILPTTTALPLTGVKSILATLKHNKNTQIFCSSSAKGGLSIVAIGIVPELTLYMAEITAYSAGGKIVKVFDFKLGAKDVELIDALNPDIILFAGGTDGGNELYNLHNAKMLTKLKANSTILYAGNKAIADEIASILADKPLEIAPNILPQIDNPYPEKAREKIRDIFLKRIIECKGIGAISKLAGHDPYPTPYSVFELIQAIPKYRPDWDSFCLIDMGGATTDFYSYHKEETEPGIVYKGIKEPNAKRTVEGDLGMRVSAASAFAAGKEYLNRIYSAAQLQTYAEYVNKVCANIGYIPKGHEEIDFDAKLAHICIGLAAARHCGRRKRIFTAQGEGFLQHGKDLTKVRKIVGSGGFLAKFHNFKVGSDLFAAFQDLNAEEIKLLPQAIEYYIDNDYLIPLLANLVHTYPQASVNSAIKALKPASIFGGNT